MFLYSWKGLLRRLRCFVLRREPVVRGACRMCGTCCTDITLVMDGQVVRDRLELRDVVRRYPGYSRFRPSGVDKRGNMVVSCTLLGEDGACTDHDNRLDLCRDHPGPPHYFSGAPLHPGCGFRFEEVRRFSAVLRREKRQALRENRQR